MPSRVGFLTNIQPRQSATWDFSAGHPRHSRRLISSGHERSEGESTDGRPPSSGTAFLWLGREDIGLIRGRRDGRRVERGMSVTVRRLMYVIMNQKTRLLRSEPPRLLIMLTIHEVRSVKAGTSYEAWMRPRGYVSHPERVL